MKVRRILSVAFIAAALIGCSQEEQLGLHQENKMQFSGSFEQVNTRVSMNGNYDMSWDSNDEVSIFPGITVNNRYKVNGVTDGKATFSFVDYVDPVDGYSKIGENYALYPYANENSITAGGIITTSVPATFNYEGLEKSINTALMAAKSNSNDLNFKNVQGILRLKLNADQPLSYGPVKSIKLESASNILSGKVNIEFENGLPKATLVEGGNTLVLNLDEQKVLSKVGSYSEFYIPMVPAEFAANGVKLTIEFETETYTKDITIPFNIERRKIYTLVHTLKAANFEGDLEGELENPIYVATIAELQDAINNATGETVINIAADITGDAVVPQKENVNIDILGHGFKFNGVITVDGKSSAYATAGLTIRDLNFAAETISEDACIRLGGTDATRYTSNVTVENCTFDVPGAVGIKSYTGGDKNLTIKGCTATANAHSLVQVANIEGEGIEVIDCIINSKNGMNFNNTAIVNIENCTANVRGYAARFGASGSASGTAETYLIKNSTLKSTCEEAGDAVIILRGTADKATLTIERTTITGPSGILNSATGTTVTIDGKVVATNSSELKAMIAGNATEIFLADGAVIEGTFTVKRAVTISSVNAENKATIKGRVNIANANPTFKNIIFDRNADSDAEWNTANGSSNCLQYKAVVMIYGNQLNKITFNACDFLNNMGTHKSAITSTACDLVIDGCYFEGHSSAIYAQTNLSITNSTFNYTGTSNVIASLNGVGAEGGKFIFTGNNIIGDQIFVLAQFLSTTGFGNGTYHFNVQNNTGAGFENLFFNTNRVANKTFAEGSATF